MASWKDALGLIAKLAPTIGSALGTPLVGTGIAALESALKINPGAADIAKRQDAIAAAVTNATPEQMLAIKNADHEFSERMAELGFQNQQAIEQLNVQDRANARARQVQLRDWAPTFLMFSVTIGFFGSLMLLMFEPVPKDSQALVFSLIGSLAAGWTGLITYYFGSSAGSAVKTDMLAKASPIKE